MDRTSTTLILPLFFTTCFFAGLESNAQQILQVQSDPKQLQAEQMQIQNALQEQLSEITDIIYHFSLDARRIPDPITVENISNCNCWLTRDATWHISPMTGTIDPATGLPCSGCPGIPANYRNDDSYTNPPIALPFNFCLKNVTRNSVYINNNGNVSFGIAYSTYTPDAFPDVTFPEMIAPFFGDVDTRNFLSGLVYYQLTATHLAVQWENVGYYNQHADKKNTFQLILTDGTDPIIGVGNNVAFCYKDMQWTTGDASLGVNGFYGYPATVGVNFGDGINFLQIGRFDRPGNSYLGPQAGVTVAPFSGVSWLDFQHFEFNWCNSSDTVNVPPIAANLTFCDTLSLCVGDTANPSVTFLSPESNQITTITYTTTLANVVTVSNSPANTPTIIIRVIATAADVGYNTITFTANDNGNPSGQSTVSVLVHVFPLPVASIASTNVSCFGGNNGSAIVTASNGTGAYSYTWSPSGGNGITAAGLSANTYTVAISDSAGCHSIPTTVVITQPPALTSPTSVTNVSCANGANGSAYVTAIGGAPGYTYLWSPSGGTGATASNLSAGTYTVTVTDSHGCTHTSTAVIGTNPSPTVSSLVTTSYCPVSNQIVNTTYTTNSYADVTVCATNPSGYITNNQTCTDPNNADCAGNFQKDSLTAPYAIMGAALTAASVQSVYVSLDTIVGNNSRGCGDDDRVWLRSPGGTLFLLAAQKATNNITTNKYKPTFTLAAPLGVLPNAVGSYNSAGYLPDQSALSAAPWLGQAPGAVWAGNGNENYAHAAGQWMVYTNDEVAAGGCNPNGNYTKITEFCMTFRTYPNPTYSWSTDPSSTAGCSTYLPVTNTANPTIFIPGSGSYNCTYNVVMTDAMGCTATGSVNVNCDPLPISLLSYSGKNTVLGNKLEWITSSEINNHYFTIERSTDGSSFTDLKIMLSKAPNGNSDGPLDYSITDEDIKAGIYYYRLTQTDINGYLKIVGIIIIQVNNQKDILNINPNPCHNFFNIVFNDELDIENTKLKIFDVTGRVVHEQTINSKIQTVSPKLSAGVYFVWVSDEGKVYAQKLVVE